jgi:hypothetical protein
MTRAEHLAWAKERALEYADQGDTVNTLNSMLSDLQKHPETANHPGMLLGTREAVAGYLETPAQLRHWVEGFR